MGNLRAKRVEKLEERRRKRSKKKHASASREIPEHERRLRWEVSSRHRRAETTPRSAKHARSIIAHRRYVGWLGRYSAQSLIDAILYGDPLFNPPSETTELSRDTVEFVVFGAIHAREEGTAHMRPELTPAWGAIFEGGAELRRLYGAIAPETFAEWVFQRIDLKERGATEEELHLFDRGKFEPLGITPALERRAAGSDLFEITEEEASWRLSEHTVPLKEGDWGWRLEKRLQERLLERRETTKKPTRGTSWRAPTRIAEARALRSGSPG